MHCRKLKELYLLAQQLLRKYLATDVKFPESRSLTGRLLYWDHLRD